MRFLLRSIMLLAILVSGCAPMPGPSLSLNVQDMTQDEMITYLDNNRGPGLMIQGFGKCGSEGISIREQMNNNRVFIHKLGTADTIGYCTGKVFGVKNPVVVTAIALLLPALACAEVTELYDPWYPGYYECNIYWDVTYSGNMYELAHELRHVQGYDDVFY